MAKRFNVHDTDLNMLDYLSWRGYGFKPGKGRQSHYVISSFPDNANFVGGSGSDLSSVSIFFNRYDENKPLTKAGTYARGSSKKSFVDTKDNMLQFVGEINSNITTLKEARAEMKKFSEEYGTETKFPVVAGKQYEHKADGTEIVRNVAEVKNDGKLDFSRIESKESNPDVAFKILGEQRGLPKNQVSYLLKKGLVQGFNEQKGENGQFYEPEMVLFNFKDKDNKTVGYQRMFADNALADDFKDYSNEELNLIADGQMNEIGQEDNKLGQQRARRVLWTQRKEQDHVNKQKEKNANLSTKKNDVSYNQKVLDELFNSSPELKDRINKENETIKNSIETRLHKAQEKGQTPLELKGQPKSKHKEILDRIISNEQYKNTGIFLNKIKNNQDDLYTKNKVNFDKSMSKIRYAGNEPYHLPNEFNKVKVHDTKMIGANSKSKFGYNVANMNNPLSKDIDKVIVFEDEPDLESFRSLYASRENNKFKGQNVVFYSMNGAGKTNSINQFCEEMGYKPKKVVMALDNDNIKNPIGQVDSLKYAKSEMEKQNFKSFYSQFQHADYKNNQEVKIVKPIGMKDIKDWNDLLKLKNQAREQNDQALIKRINNNYGEQSPAFYAGNLSNSYLASQSLDRINETGRFVADVFKRNKDWKDYEETNYLSDESKNSIHNFTNSQLSKVVPIRDSLNGLRNSYKDVYTKQTNLARQQSIGRNVKNNETDLTRQNIENQNESVRRTKKLENEETENNSQIVKNFSKGVAIEKAIEKETPTNISKKTERELKRERDKFYFKANVEALKQFENKVNRNSNLPWTYEQNMKKTPSREIMFNGVNENNKNRTQYDDYMSDVKRALNDDFRKYKFVHKDDRIDIVNKETNKSFYEADKEKHKVNSQMIERNRNQYQQQLRTPNRQSLQAEISQSR